MRAITDQQINQAFSDLKGTYGGVRQDYFGLLFLERALGLQRDLALQRVAFGANDYGIDGYHVDEARRTLFLFQFKWSTNHSLFRGTLDRLISAGIDEVFRKDTGDRTRSEILNRLRSTLVRDQALIDRVFISLVFNGGVEGARKSAALEALVEQVLEKQHRIDEYFGREVQLLVEYRSAADLDGYVPPVDGKPHTFELKVGQLAEREGPGGEKMHVGFATLGELHRIHKALGVSFLARNIRAALSDESSPNRSIRQSLRAIVDGKQSADVFCFHHNGVTLGAQKVELNEECLRVSHPRLLNGAQTLSTFAAFLKKESDRVGEDGLATLGGIAVHCRIVSGATEAFLTSVTVNNNRQNPVMPWNLRANDGIQLALQDKFREELGLYYERQERMFDSLSVEDVEDLAISPDKPIEVLRLARTFLASDGLVDRMNSMREAFEADTIYSQMFDESRLNANSRDIVLCYKIQYRLPKLIRHLVEKFPAKYGFLNRARYLVWALQCQAVLNDPRLEERRGDFGEDLATPGSFVEWLQQLATSRVGVLIKTACQIGPYDRRVREERLDFLRSQAFYNCCMEVAGQKWGWVRKRLR